MSELAQMRAGEHSAALIAQATASGSPILRMDSAFPSMRLTRRPLMVWIDSGRVRTSDGPMRGHEICAALMDMREDSTSKRTLVLPSLSDARRLLAALGTAKFRTADQRNTVYAGKRALRVAIGTPWFSPVLIVSRALSYRYWAPGFDGDDIDAWARAFQVPTARSELGMQTLLEKATKGQATWGRLATRLNSTSERVLKAQMFPSAVNDAKTFSGMEAIGDLWRALCAADHRLRPYSVAARKTVAARFERPTPRRPEVTATIPAGSVPFRERSTLWIVDPAAKTGTDLAGGVLAGFGFEDGAFRILLRPTTKSDHWSVRSAAGREVYLIEAPFGGAPRFSRDGSAWDSGVPPIQPIRRSVPADLARIGAAAAL